MAEHVQVCCTVHDITQNVDDLKTSLHCNLAVTRSKIYDDGTLIQREDVF
jgi:hypothetical protein